MARLPAGIVAEPRPSDDDDDHDDDETVRAGTAADGATIKEGFLRRPKTGASARSSTAQPSRSTSEDGKGGDGISPSRQDHPRPSCRSAMPCATCCAPRPAAALGAGRRSGCARAYSSFIRYYGPINHTVVTTLTDAETGEEREVHRRPNLAHFADDPDCWLVASIEDYDLETGIARMGPIFRERVVSPPATAADHLARPTRSPSR